MADVFLDTEIKVNKNKPISIGVRFTAGDEFFCTTNRGFHHDNIDHRVRTNEPGAFTTKDNRAMCTKDETDRTYG